LSNSVDKSSPNNNILPVILSGGKGTRLWPLSRTSLPKQYLNLDKDSENSLLQDTFLRLKGIKNLINPLVICNEDQRFIVAEQFRAIGAEPWSILLEPFGRDTAPAIALAALICKAHKFDPFLLILSSDHKIKNKKNFLKVINKGLEYANKGEIVTFGIKPNFSNSNYGYIESEKKISSKNIASKIKRFIEKPTKEVAQELIKDDHFSWNSGIFLFKSSTIIEQLEKYQPGLIDICEESLKNNPKDIFFQRINSEIFKKCPNIAIDKAVMEHTEIGTVISLEAGWNDLGSWEAVWKDSISDVNKNTLIGNVFTKNVKNSYIRSESRLIVGIGLADVLLIETEDAILAARKDKIDSLKDLVKELDKQNYKEIKLNRKIHRPWGHYVSLIEDETWQVKRIEINPKESLSLQMHKYRSEHWIVVDGIAKVEIDKKIFFLNKNESTYVPLGATHRLSNPGEIALILIEVQSGTYLGEDDIIRFEDKYRRKTF
tara:strand:+ start:3424 stop:4887 length:1464 start_codon:yes stop_codon:yes gene_type:complete